MPDDAIVELSGSGFGQRDQLLDGLTGNDGCTTTMNGSMFETVIGAKSLTGSYGVVCMKGHPKAASNDQQGITIRGCSGYDFSRNNPLGRLSTITCCPTGLHPLCNETRHEIGAAASGKGNDTYGLTWIGLGGSCTDSHDGNC